MLVLVLIIISALVSVAHLFSFPLSFLFFFFNDPSTTEIYTLSLHDALPISGRDPGDLLLPLVERLDVLERRGDDRLHMHETGRVPLLGHGEDAALAFVGEFRHVAVLLVSELGDGAGSLDQAAGQRLLMDDLRVPGEVGGSGDDLVQ